MSHIRSKLMSIAVALSLLLGSFAVAATPTLAEDVPITPSTVNVGPEEFTISVQNVSYETWGFPTGNCSSFDDKRPIRKFNVSIQIKNVTNHDIGPFGFGLFDGDLPTIVNCYYGYEGIGDDLSAGQARNITLVGFVYPQQSISKLIFATPTSARAVCFVGTKPVACAGSAPAAPPKSPTATAIPPKAPAPPKSPAAPVAPTKTPVPAATVAPPPAPVAPSAPRLPIAAGPTLPIDLPVSVSDARFGYASILVQNSGYERWGMPVDECKTFDDKNPVRNFKASLKITNTSKQTISGWATVPMLSDDGAPIRSCYYGYNGIFDPLPSGASREVTYSYYLKPHQSVRGVFVIADVGFQVMCFDDYGKQIACNIGPGEIIKGNLPIKSVVEARIGFSKAELLNLRYFDRVAPRVTDCVANDVGVGVNRKVQMTLRITNEANAPITGASALMTTNSGKRYLSCPQEARSGDIKPIPAGGSRDITFVGFVRPGETVQQIIIATDAGLEVICVDGGKQASCAR